MDFKSLRYVLSAVEHPSLSEAARSLGISQPSLSKFLQNISSSLGVQLFERNEGRLRPTYAGERYISYARQILALASDLYYIEEAKKQDLFLRIICPPHEGSYIHPFAIMQFHREISGVELIITEDSDYTSPLIHGEADFAICISKPENAAFNSELFIKDEILLVTNSQHPIVKQGAWKENCIYPWVDIQYIQNEPIIRLEPMQNTRMLSDALLSSKGIEPVSVMQTGSTLSAVRAASAGIGICFALETGIRDFIFPEPPAFLSIGDPLTMDVHIVWPKARKLSAEASCFITLMRSFLLARVK